jgi:hypothetical protein
MGVHGPVFTPSPSFGNPYSLQFSRCDMFLLFGADKSGHTRAQAAIAFPLPFCTARLAATSCPVLSIISQYKASQLTHQSSRKRKRRKPCQSYDVSSGIGTRAVPPTVSCCVSPAENSAATCACMASRASTAKRGVSESRSALALSLGAINVQFAAPDQLLLLA